MKICVVAEGCYPYVVGGVSGWINSMIKAFPDIEFVILSIIANRKQSGKFVYELPANVSAVYEAYLDDVEWESEKKSIKRLTKEQYHELRCLIFDLKTNWQVIFDLFQEGGVSINQLLMGPDFLHIVQEYYEKEYPQIVFSDFLWTMRSIYLPMFLILYTKLPQADIYHCVATGYAGVLGSMAKYKYGCGLIISEHGIYTREREEELLKATWVTGIYKNIWIAQFKKMSQLAYDSADCITCLYHHAKELQIDLGCQEDKIRITPNGIDVERFANLPGKETAEKPEEGQDPETAAEKPEEGQDPETAAEKPEEGQDPETAGAETEDGRKMQAETEDGQDPQAAGEPARKEKKEESIDIGAVLRVAPIKDVKTMIRAFSFAKGQVPNLKLWIMGPCDEDEEYARECYELVDMLNVKDVVFTGRINVLDYLGKMDFTILTSISEGQPLTILESYAAHRPVIATDVGNCRELIYGGEGDEFGTAGILTHIMNTKELAEAMVRLAQDEELRKQMGECGYQRVCARYSLKQMRDVYRELYQEIYELAR